jgi:hypothetical protein
MSRIVLPSVSVVAGPTESTVRSREFQARISGKKTLNMYTARYHLGSNTYLAPRHTSLTTLLAKRATGSAGVGPRTACDHN